MPQRARTTERQSDQHPTRPAGFSRPTARVQRPQMSENMIAVTDGREVASSGSPDDLPSIELLKSVLRSLERFGYDVIVVVDDDLRLEIERSQSGSKTLERATISLAPAGVDRDSLVLSIADDTGATVVSNHRFEEYLARFPWLTERRIPYRVHRGQAYLDPEELMGVF